MKIIIPVAGKGTRMRPFTHSQPKALLPVAGKPVIDHILDKVLPLEPTEVVFVTGHLGHAFPDHIKRKYPTLKATYVEQKVQRGTADAIWTARDAFDEDVLIIFSDTIFDADLSIIKTCKDAGIIWGVRVPDPARFGVMLTDGDGYLQGIIEKPPEFVSDLANIGLYYIKDIKALTAGIEHVFTTTPAGKEVYLTGAFTYMIENGARIKVPAADGWYDTGTVEETLLTNETLLQKFGGTTERPGVRIIPPVAIDPSAHIEESTIGPFVTIGPEVTITNSVIRDAIVDRHSKIVDSKLTHTIIGQHVEVREVEGSLLLGDHSRVGKSG